MRACVRLIVPMALLMCSVAAGDHAPSHSEVKICSSEGLEALGKMGTNPEKLKAYCSGTADELGQESQRYYDIASGKNDFAELADDVREHKSIGARVRFTVSNSVSRTVCIMGDEFEGKTTLFCTTPESGSVHIICSDRRTRVELLKSRQGDFAMTFTGRALGMYSSYVVVEVESPGSKKRSP